MLPSTINLSMKPKKHIQQKFEVIAAFILLLTSASMK